MATVAATVAELTGEGLLPGQIIGDWERLPEADREDRFALGQLSDRMMRSMARLALLPPAFTFGMDEARQARYAQDPVFALQVRTALEHREGLLDEAVRVYHRLLPRSPIYARVLQFRAWWVGQRAILLDSLLPWTRSNLRIDPGDRLREFNESLAAWQEGREPDPGRPERYAFFQQALGHFFYRRGYCMYQGSFYVTVPGTYGRALSRLVQALDDEQDEVAGSMDAEAVVWQAVEQIPDIYSQVLSVKTARSDVVQLIELIKVAGPRSRLIAQAKPSYRLFAFPGHGALEIAEAPNKRRADGSLKFSNGTMRPCCRLVSFEALPDDVVTVRNLGETEDTWTPGAPTMPLGWLRLRPGHELVPRPDPPSNSEDGRSYQAFLESQGRARRRYWLPRPDDESDFDWLRRFAGQFERVERTGREFRSWLQNEETYYVTDLWEAWYEVWTRWVETLPPQLAGIDMTPPERVAAFDRWEEARWTAALPPDLRDLPPEERRAAAASRGLPPPNTSPPNPFAGTLLGATGACLQVMAMQRYSDQAMMQMWTMMGKSLYWGKLCTNWQLLILFQGLSRTGKGILLELMQDFFGYEGCHTVEEKKGDKYSTGDANRKRVLMMTDIGGFGVHGLTEEEVLRMVAHELFAARRMATMQEIGTFMPHLLFATNNPKLMDARMALGTRSCQFTHYEDVLKAGLLTGYLARWRRSSTGANLCMAVRCLMLAHDAIGPAGSMQTYMPAACRDARIRMRQTADYARFFCPAGGWVAWDADAATPLQEVLGRLQAVRQGDREVRPPRQNDPDFEAALTENGFRRARVGDVDVVQGLRLTDQQTPLWRPDPETE